MNKVILKFAAAILFVAAWTSSTSADQTMSHQMTVFKSPQCGCCGDWVKIMTEAGFKVVVHEREDLDAVKKLARIPEDLQACHTAKVGGYLVEGHVPARTIKRLLTQKPDIRGLSVPGMPFGSPGMGHNPDARYDVMTLEKEPKATAEVYEKIGD